MSSTYRPDLLVFSTKSMWRRSKVYLEALALTTVVFFFVAGWVAAPDDADDAFRWLSVLPGTIALIVSATATALGRRGHRATEKRHPEKR